jgi:hypothetical protein
VFSLITICCCLVCLFTLILPPTGSVRVSEGVRLRDSQDSLTEHEGLFVDLNIQIGLFVCRVSLLSLLIILSFVAASGCVVRTPAIAEKTYDSVHTNCTDKNLTAHSPSHAW